MKRPTSESAGAGVRALDATLKMAVQRVEALKKDARQVKSELKQAKKAAKRAAKALRRARKSDTPPDDAAESMETETQAAKTQKAARLSRTKTGKKTATEKKAKTARKKATVPQAAAKQSSGKRAKAVTRAKTAKAAKTKPQPSRSAVLPRRTVSAETRGAPAPEAAPPTAGGDTDWNQDEWTVELPVKSE